MFHFACSTEDFPLTRSAELRAEALTLSLSPSPVRYLFTVAQIFNLLYRRFVIGRALLAGDRWQVKNLRYSAARRSRNQYDPTTDEHGWTRIRESPSSSVLIRVHPWLKKIFACCDDFGRY
jgi:hypothetical protein